MSHDLTQLFGTFVQNRKICEICLFHRIVYYDVNIVILIEI